MGGAGDETSVGAVQARMGRMLHPSIGAVESLVPFGEDLYGKAQAFVEDRIGRFAARSTGLRDRVMDTVAWLDRHEPALLGESEGSGAHRIAVLRDWQGRLRMRRHDPRIVGHETTVRLLQALEEELEHDANELETLDEAQTAKARARLRLVRIQAERHLITLARHTAAQGERKASLVRELDTNRVALRDWARGQRTRVQGFVHERLAASRAIRGPAAIGRWADTSLGQAARLAGAIRSDASARHATIIDLAERRRTLATAVFDEAERPLDTVEAWQRESRTTRRSAMDDLRLGLDRTRQAMTSGGRRASGKLRAITLQRLDDATGESPVAALQEDRREFDRTMETAPNPASAAPALERDVATAHPTFHPAREDAFVRPPLDAGSDHEPERPPADRPRPSAGAARSSPEVATPSIVPPFPVHTETERLAAPSIDAHHASTPGESRTVRTEQATTIATPRVSDASVDVPRTIPDAEPRPTPDSRVAKGEAVAPIPTSKPLNALRQPEKRKAPSPAHATPTTKPTASGGAVPPRTSQGDALPKALARQSALVERGEVARAEPLARPMETTHAQPRPSVQRRGTGPEPVADAGALRKSLTAASSGTPLSTDVRQSLAHHVGFDPSMVRVHTGALAATAAQALRAEAFTIGHDVFFAQDRFDPTSPKGLGLIGHEVTHVGQQLGKRGDRAQMHSRSGGDAMEHEAREVGERVERDLAYGSSLRVARFVRHYEAEGDGSIEPGDAARLDRIAVEALRKAGKLLAKARRPRSIRVDRLDVDVSLDLAEMTDDEAAEAWAEAIVAAAEALPANGQAETEAPPPTTRQLLQRDPVDESRQAALDKIRGTEEEHELIRKLLVRDELDPLVTASQGRQRVKEADDQFDPDFHHGVHYSGKIDEADRPAIEAILKKSDIQSLDDYEKVRNDFLAHFEQKGLAVVDYLLNENVRIIQEQQTRYLKADELELLRAASRRLLPPLDAFIDEFNADVQDVVDRTWGPGVQTMDRDNYDSLRLDTLHQTVFSKEQVDRLNQKWHAFADARNAEGDVHPVFLNRDFNPSGVLTDDAAGVHLFYKMADIRRNIQYVRDNMTGAKVWGMPEVVAQTKSAIGVRPQEGADKTVNEKAQTVANDAAISNALQAGAAIALGIVAMVASGGLATVALVGAAGLSVHGAAKHLSDYAFEDAASHSALDQAKLLSKDEPTLLWLAIDLIAAGLDLGAEAGALKSLAAAAKAAMADKAAMKALEDAARGAYAKLPTKEISEEEFVNRLLEAAGKGEAGGKLAAQQSGLLAELIQGTSPRAAAVLKGDATAIEAVVKEHENWRGLIGGLKSGGADAERMAGKVGEYRNGLIEDLKTRGAKPLEDASADVASDFDLNVTGPDAGAKVIAFEKEMAGRFGESWSEALHLNFYTDRSQLLAYEDALKLVSPSRRAQIIQKVTKRTEELNFAKMLEHAGDNPAAIRELEATIKASGADYKIENLRKVAEGLHARGRETLLTEIDADLKALNELPAGDPRRVAHAEAITEKQMEANFLSREAYIGPAALRSGTGSLGEAYQQALSQLEMLGHVVHDAGGNIPEAMRAYEFQKYVNRYVAAARRAGVHSPTLDYFDGFSSFVYKRSRAANAATGHLPGGTTLADEASGVPVSDKFLAEQYEMFRAEVDRTLPQIRANAAKNPGGGWKPEVKSPSVNSTMDPSPAVPPPPGPPGGTSGATGNGSLPGAVYADKAAKELAAPGKAVTTPLNEREVMMSAGSKSSMVGENVGVFRGRIAGVDHPVAIKVYRAANRAKMEAELAAAHAAEKTGFGPRVYGSVNAGENRVAFAMEEVQGGFADSAVGAKGTPEFAASQAEVLRNARNIKPSTYTDIADFRDRLWQEGYYYSGELQGFVDSGGHWRPIDMQGAERVSADAAEQSVQWGKHYTEFKSYMTQLIAQKAKADAASLGGQ